ncbi:hypothetical protein IU450_38400 [Nocardia abscessus]|uniref:hypothetical protein n=1 Tax=Nocardia abscessus TaxID=120957 RepID=UPI00189502A5|nr:hypothetical protein [Nocardia abscessus]MBF6341708.1 hypothetical protein [Nocardia abscessus]
MSIPELPTLLAGSAVAPLLSTVRGHEKNSNSHSHLTGTGEGGMNLPTPVIALVVCAIVTFAIICGLGAVILQLKSRVQRRWWISILPLIEWPPWTWSALQGFR